MYMIHVKLDKKYISSILSQISEIKQIKILTVGKPLLWQVILGGLIIKTANLPQIKQLTLEKLKILVINQLFLLAK